MKRVLSLALAAASVHAQEYTKIDELTAAGANSLAEVNVKGVVVADLREKLNGVYLQMYAEDADTPTGSSSQAIFVTVADGATFSVEEGDAVSLVNATFVADEQSGVSVVVNVGTNVSLEDCDEPKPTVGAGVELCRNVNLATVVLPFSEEAGAGAMTGMLANVPDMWTTNSYSIGRYGSVDLYRSKLLMNPLQYMLPGDEAYNQPAIDTSTGVLRLEAPTPYDQWSIPNPFPAGGFNDSVVASERQGLTAGMKFPASLLSGHVVLRSGYPNKLSLTKAGMEIVPENMLALDDNREEFPPMETVNSIEDKKFLISGMNVENYFITFCNDYAQCRGAKNEEDFIRQREKIFLTIGRMDAAILGIQEVENDADGQAHAHLVEYLNKFLQEHGFEDQVYDYINTPQSGPDRIKNGIIYQPKFATPVGNYSLYEFEVKSYARARDSLAQTFQIGDELVTIVSNHLQYKGSGALHPSCSARRFCDQYTEEEAETEPCVVDGGCDKRDGQGSWATLRHWEAEELIDWIATNPTGELPEGNKNYILLGDFNAYSQEDAIRYISNNGFVELASRDIETPYSYNFGGFFQTLDYAFLSNSIAGKCGKAAGLETIEWHTNSPESTEFGYRPSGTDDGVDDIYALTPFRSSDHDPILFACDFSPKSITVAPSLPDASGASTVSLTFMSMIATAIVGLVLV